MLIPLIPLDYQDCLGVFFLLVDTVENNGVAGYQNYSLDEWVYKYLENPLQSIY